MEKSCKAIIGACILLAIASGVSAQDGWGFEVAPYLWAAGIEGDVEVKGRKADVDVGFDEVFDSMDIGGGLMTVARQGRLVTWGQFDYMAMDTDNVKDGPTRGSLEMDTFFGAIAIGRQFDGPFEGSTIDVMGGIRYAWMEGDLTLNGVGRGKSSLDIVDAILVVRPCIPLSKKWRLNSTLSIGAGDSDLVWELQPSLLYQICNDMTLNLGYRRLHYDVTGDKNNTFDAAFQGLLIGLGVTF